jgi:hypothetical protein
VFMALPAVACFVPARAAARVDPLTRFARVLIRGATAIFRGGDRPGFRREKPSTKAGHAQTTTVGEQDNPDLGPATAGAVVIAAARARLTDAGHDRGILPSELLLHGGAASRWRAVQKDLEN